jgi:5'-nucleotidase
MPDILTITISDKTLFDIPQTSSETSAVATKRSRVKKLQAYNPGPGFRFVKQLSQLKDSSGANLVHINLISTLNPLEGDILFHSISHHALNLGAIAFSALEPVKLAKAYGADLFLHHDEETVKQGLQSGLPSAYLHKGSYASREANNLHIIMDGDCVLFSDESERAFTSCPVNGLANFFKYEADNRKKTMQPGPLSGLLHKLHKVKNICPNSVILSLVTARTFPTHERPLITLKAWGINLDNYCFMAGRSKSEIIRTLDGDIFFDDQSKHCTAAAPHTPSAQVFNVTTTHAGT